MRVICSIGPNVKSNQDLDNLVKVGMKDARFNFSHVDYIEVKKYIKYLKEKHPDVRIVQDLQGNKIRISDMYQNEARVRKGEEIFFCSEEFYKKQFRSVALRKIIPVKSDFEFLDLVKNKKIFMKDRTMEFRVLGKVKDQEAIKVEVVNGGVIRKEKGINFPNLERQNARLTAKDKKDIIFGIENEVDVICLSYVASEKEFKEFKNFVNDEIKKQKKVGYKPKVWGKIECKDAITELDKIIKISDGIMLGRGDLYSELNMFEIPKIQSEVIKKLKTKKTKECIIATYILESMKSKETPNISEINEIYSFMCNKVDSIMLASEVTIGKNPLKTVKFITDFIEENSKENLKSIIQV